jgi:hypothetical protein
MDARHTVVFCYFGFVRDDRIARMSLSLAHAGQGGKDRPFSVLRSNNANN